MFDDIAYTTLTSASATPCRAVGRDARYLVGVVNNSLLPQPVTVLVFDNATAADGAVVASIGLLGVSQVITYPAPGLRLQNGACAIASGAPVGKGIQILVR